VPFPVSIRGVFDYPTAGEPGAAAALAAQRIERALTRLGAQDVERYGDTIAFEGPALETVRRSNPLLILARGEVDVLPPPIEGAPGRVRYAMRTTRGLGILAGLLAASELLARILGGPREPLFASAGVIAIVWGAHYVLAWIRVPLLLMRAVDGASDPRRNAPRESRHRGAAT